MERHLLVGAVRKLVLECGFKRRLEMICHIVLNCNWNLTAGVAIVPIVGAER